MKWAYCVELGRFVKADEMSSTEIKRNQLTFKHSDKETNLIHVNGSIPKRKGKPSLSRPYFKREYINETIHNQENYQLDFFHLIDNVG